MKLMYKIWLDDGGKAFGEGPYRLLKGVQASGSLAQAAKDQNMSYSRAHGLMKQISAKLGFALLEGHAGGSGGGGARVTVRAQDLMRRYETMIQESEESLESIFARHFGVNHLLTDKPRPKLKKDKQEVTIPLSWKPLSLTLGDVVALVGGDGKSNIMYALAEELSFSGAKVLLTTTAEINLPVHGTVHRLIVSDKHGIMEQVRQGVKPGEIVALGSGVRDGKLLGFTPEYIDKLAEMVVADYIFVEADGITNSLFKAPDLQEPLIPQSATVVLNVVGQNALEIPLTKEFCNRPELAASISGIPAGARLDSRAIADIMFSVEGGRKNVPRQAQWLPVINKIDTTESLTRAVQIARALKVTGAEDVLFASMQNGNHQVRIWGGK
ncbi:MAG: selenium cofactor biosynthesis protein YqeC [Firmicutes bacterium]|nr:selenium cofactor biosynthesis protein YqeC [Bacillota bacterium]